MEVPDNKLIPKHYAEHTINKRGFYYDHIWREDKAFKKKNHLTQKQLGLAIGFSEGCADTRIAQYESGQRTPKENIKKKLAQELGVPLEILIVPVLSEPREYLVEAFWIQELAMASNYCFIFDSP